MGAVYRSICTEADALLLIVTRLAEKEIKLKLDIERLMNEGFVNIAKARYIMGSTCVTKMQLPTKNSNPIKPLVTVCRKEINNNWVFCISRKNCFKSSESINEVLKDSVENSEYDFKSTTNSKTSITSPDVSEAAFKNLMQNDPKSLKKSKNAFLVENDLYQSYNEELLDEMSNSDSHESLVSVTDPIRLFGILVPKALKEAQVVFNDVVDLLGECATVQWELKEALHKFNHLEKVKNLIIAASKEMKLDVLTPKVYWTPSESSSVSCYSVEEKGEEEEEENEEKDKLSEVSIKKSIRSVFYDVENVGPQETELSDIWPSVISEHESDN